MELMEDDVFFADLSKRIALLIKDDEEEGIRFPAQCPELAFQQRVPIAMLPQTMLPPAYAGGHEADYGMGCKGTGVFIPRSTLPRRKTRTARTNCCCILSNSSSDSKSNTKRPSIDK